MFIAIHRVYITQRAKRYVSVTKQHIAALIAEQGYSPAELSQITKIPLTNLNRWLDPVHDTFMPLAAAHVIAEHLRISVRDMLPPDEIGSMSAERYEALAVFMTAPVPHVALMADTYRKMIRLTRE